MTMDPITHGEEAGITETSTDNLLPPGAEPYAEVDAEAQVARLEEFLAEYFPAECGLTNRQGPETPIDTAIRLLTGLSTSGVTERCAQEYCNKPLGHQGQHGWVHYH